MQEKDPSTPLQLTLSQAAELLGYNVKTLRRLIKAKKLRARLDTNGGYRIDRSDVWHILHDRHDWCDRCAGIQQAERIRDFKIAETDPAERWDFLDWDEPVSCEEIPEFEVTLGVTELRRVLSALRREGKSREEYEAMRDEFRARIESVHRQRPGRFTVVLKIDEKDSYELCRRIIRMVKRPTIPGLFQPDLDADAIQHLILNALPHIGRARSIEPYLSRALINFYRDRLRYAGIGKKGVKKRAGRRDESVDLEESGRLADGSYLIARKPPDE